MSHAPVVKTFEKKLIVITAPSGAGKTSIVKKLLRHFPNFAFSVSATTRDKRTGEEHGKDYYFLSHEEFKKKINEHAFAEHEEVYANQFYGTLKDEIERLWAMRKTVIFDIDVKGAENLKKQFGLHCHAIFIKPPSKETLLNRLKARSSESADSLKKRLKRAEEELTYENKFDYVVENKDFDIAYMRVKNSIVRFLNPTPVFH